MRGIKEARRRKEEEEIQKIQQLLMIDTPKSNNSSKPKSWNKTQNILDIALCNYIKDPEYVSFSNLYPCDTEGMQS